MITFIGDTTTLEALGRVTTGPVEHDVLEPSTSHTARRILDHGVLGVTLRECVRVVPVV
jgi:hypothetical protein